jgi:opacity protein-like surface antigen
MRQALLALLAILSLLTLPLHAQNWSIGAGAGPFVFGDFVRETLRPIGPGSGEPTTIELSAKTRPGVSVDLERNLTGRFAVRVEGTFTHSKLAVRTAEEGGVTLDVGTLDVTTFTLPLVIRFNRNGTFRFHIMGGPAYAMYEIERDVTPAGTPDSFSGTRSRWGGAAGAGVGWWFSDRFAIEGQITDIVTASPFRREELSNAQSVTIPKPQNVHTTVGIRVRF